MSIHTFLIFCPLMENATLSTLVNLVTSTLAPDDDDERCVLSFHNYSNDCSYALSHSDACEGGGYLLWTSYVVCQETAVARGFTIFGSVVFLAFLFLMITAAADDFFSTNVSAIIDHLKISQNIAGVTFMAFGNGAPDIFSSLASVISVKQPKAGLAVGELLGGGIFVTTVVVASIVLARPFHVMRRPILRDIVFYLIAVAWTVFVFLYGENEQMLIWEPIGFIVIYVIYAVTVIVGRFVRQRSRRKEKLERRRRSVYPTQIPTIAVMETDEKSEKELSRRRTADTVGSDTGSVFENGKFFCHEETDDEGVSPRSGEEDTTSTDSSLVYVSHDHNVVAVSEVRASVAHIPQLPPPPETEVSWQGLLLDAAKHLSPVDPEEYAEASILMKAFILCKAPIMFVLKCSTPLAESAWSKPIALLHAFTGPIFLVFSFQLAQKQIGPIGIWAYALMVSVIIAAFIYFLTEFDKTPKYYKQFACYAGFVLSVAWIYMVSSEVVDVVNMIGIMSGISHEVLGLTILAWSNSIGDLIADISVARQGFPRMAISAAIGGPCFNLLIGFGFPFLIACAQGKEVIIDLDTVKKVMLIFLALSLVLSLVLLPAQRFNARRPYALVLVGLYVVFLVLVVLAELKVYSF
uniref:Na_Ca_ex domain-containing protein n=1 Tax=Steinernema glaseri TaxID=37863 RepID=A0A1I8AG63_9BILA